MPFLRLVILFLCLAPFGFALDQAAYQAAVALYAEHRAPEAQKAFESLAAAAPDNADIQFYLGRLALQRDDHAQAVGYLEKAVALSPQDSRMHQRLGDAYGLSAQKAGFFSQLSWAGKCRAEYEKAVALDAKNVDAHWSLMEYYRQAPSIAGGGNDKAMAEAQTIKQLDVTRGRIAVASVLAADGKYAEAFQEFDEALRAKPDDYAALYQVGRLAAISGQQLERGRAVLLQCLAMAAPAGQPGPAAIHWRMGNILEKKGDPAGARAAYEAALKADPGFTQARDALKKL